jgi:hypothetical protein
MPSAALYVVVFTFSRGFESYLRSHSFVQFVDGLRFDCPAIFSKTPKDFPKRVENVDLVGFKGKVKWTRDEKGSNSF